MLNDVLKQSEDKMKKTLSDFEQELKSLRTGRASAHMVDHIRVDYYGTLTPLNQLATISTRDSAAFSNSSQRRFNASPRS